MKRRQPPWWAFLSDRGWRLALGVGGLTVLVVWWSIGIFS